MVVDPNEAVSVDSEDDEDEEASSWRAKLKDWFRKLLSPARY
jgi:hypothetical protein